MTLPSPPTEQAVSGRALDIALRTLAIEAKGLASLQRRLSHDSGARHAFAQAVELILHGTRVPQHGRVIVSGMGKSGHIARKMAATLASTGTPAYFVHPAEASHGDLGMVTGQDVFVAISNSGESQELLAIVPILKRSGAKLIAMTGQPGSALARLADAYLNSGVEQEACPLNLAPTASTTVQLALGDALAVALLDARGFSADDFARSHPGGALGRKLLTRVRDVMRSGEALPQVATTSTLPQAILEMSRKGIGMTAVMNAENQVAGVFTDGDLRRLLEKSLDLSGFGLSQVMNTAPKSIAPEALAAEAAEIMDRYKVNQLLVLEQGLLVGALHLHDLMAAKVI